MILGAATAAIVALDRPVTGLLNHAGVMACAFQTTQGWGGAFGAKYRGPFALMEAFIPPSPAARW